MIKGSIILAGIGEREIRGIVVPDSLERMRRKQE
jgi:hypothetical protein